MPLPSPLVASFVFLSFSFVKRIKIVLSVFPFFARPYVAPRDQLPVDGLRRRGRDRSIRPAVSSHLFRGRPFSLFLLLSLRDIIFRARPRPPPFFFARTSSSVPSSPPPLPASIFLRLFFFDDAVCSRLTPSRRPSDSGGGDALSRNRPSSRRTKTSLVLVVSASQKFLFVSLSFSKDFFFFSAKKRFLMERKCPPHYWEDNWKSLHTKFFRIIIIFV